MHCTQQVSEEKPAHQDFTANIAKVHKNQIANVHFAIKTLQEIEAVWKRGALHQEQCSECSSDSCWHMVWQTYWMVWICFCSGNGSFIPNHQHWCGELLLSQKPSWEMNPKRPSPTIQTEGRMCLQWTIPPVRHFCILEGTLEMKLKDAAANFILI